MRGHDQRSRWLAAALLTVGLGLAGCTTSAASSPASGSGEPPAKVETIAGKDVKSVTLSEHAEKRLGVETVAVGQAPQGTSLPYSAVFYTPDGSAWVYTVSTPRTYVREKVVVANVGGTSGTDALLSEGPAVGSTVVKIGAIELYGAEIGVGEE